MEVRYVTTGEWDKEKKTFFGRLLRFVGGSSGMVVINCIAEHPEGITRSQIVSETGLNEEEVRRELTEALKYKLIENSK